MNEVFADTYAFLALWNPRDPFHERATEYLTRAEETIVTTTWVLAEVGNFVARGAGRGLFPPFVRDLRKAAHVTIVPADEENFHKGLELYTKRPDKYWSVTDCISFVVMKERGITWALTADHHFEQAGFTVLLK